MATFSTEFSSILEKYKFHKLQTYAVTEILGTDYVFNDLGADTDGKRFRALIECGTQLHFSKNWENGKTVYHLTGANFCRQRVCPMCQFRKSEKTFAQFLQVVRALEADFRFLHLVLTIPNARTDEELTQGVKILYKGFSKLMVYKSIRKAFKGVLRCLEISYNYDTDTFHPHLHCLVVVNRSYFNDTKSYISLDKYREMWTKSVKSALKSLQLEGGFADSPHLLQASVRAMKPGDYSGVAEVCKYCTKPLQLDPERSEQNRRFLLVLMTTLKGTRFLQKYGVIKETFAELFGESEEDETEAEQPEAARTVFVEWDSLSQTYREG